MVDWIQNNATLGAGIISAIAALIAALIHWARKEEQGPKILINNSNTLSSVIGSEAGGGNATGSGVKDSSKILFIDDDTTFPVIKILKKAGWRNTKVVRDVISLDSQDVQETDLFFVDIQGVGKALHFNDEGLGLALALKNKYPSKKLVIYSSEPRGDRFHQAFRVADDQLAKNAEPYEFQQIVEQLLLTSKK